ncbi:MAG: hypothetical protein JO215_16145 [Ktedonobacteraceae bacterium]|nr:hypothetical protein [Ktedonobacteraceae bacterium]
MIEPTRPNFFLLLELNPDEPWVPMLYQKALQDKIRQWSRDSMSIAKKALPAQANRALLPHIREVMENLELRNKEAEEARKLLATRYQAAYARFEKQLMLLNLKGSAKQEEIELFCKEFKHIMPSRELKRLIKVKIHQAHPPTSHLPQLLDASMIKNIEDRLEIIHAQTLYELLRSPRKSTTSALFQAAQALYADEVRKHPTAEVTTRIELAGFAMNLFKTDEMRARYEETLRQMSLQQLLKDITESTRRSEIKEVHPRQVLYYLKKAEEAGWSEEEALDQLKEHGRTQQWFITVPQRRAEKTDSETSVTGSIESISPQRAHTNGEGAYQARFQRTIRRNVCRRVKASILILVQLICLTALMQRKPDFWQPIRQLLTWGNQAHVALLALSVKSFQHYAQTQLAAYVPITTLHDSIAVLSLLLTILINSLSIALILTPGIPILFILIGLISGSAIGLRNLGKVLLTAHLRLYTRREVAQTKDIMLQPAQRGYPFEQGWNIENLVVEEIVGTFHELKQNWSTATDIVTDWKRGRNWFIRHWVSLIKTGCRLAGLVQDGLSVEISALCASLYITFLLLWDAGALLCIGLLRIIQALYPRLRSRTLPCPDCRQKITIPISICSTCITECPQRGPGLYGIFWYRCQGCEAKLPTLNLYGSRRFTHLCPHCRHVLNY